MPRSKPSCDVFLPEDNVKRPERESLVTGLLTREDWENTGGATTLIAQL